LENGFPCSATKMQCVYFTCRGGVHPFPTICFKDMKTLSSLGVLSWSSWNRYRPVLPQLYYALIHSKIEYSSFIYGSAPQSKLSILKPIHKAQIHLAFGTFCTSHLANIYANSLRMPPVLPEGHAFLQLCSQAGGTPS